MGMYTCMPVRSKDAVIFPGAEVVGARELLPVGAPT